MKPTTLPQTSAEAAERFWGKYGPILLQRSLGAAALPADLAPTSVEGWIELARHVQSALAAGSALPEHPVATLAEAAPFLALPFPPEIVRLKPGTLHPSVRQARGLAYVDARAYQDRLDAVVGVAGWSTTYRALGDRAIICRLTVAGVIREEVGEAPADSENPATEAVAQAFKRACAAFGLGRYLYQLPRLWFDYDPELRVIRNEAEAVRQLYAAAGLLNR